MVSEKQEVQAGEVEQEAPKTAPKTTRTRKPKATEQAKTEAPSEVAEAPSEAPAVQENTPETEAPQEAPTVQENTPETEAPSEAPAVQENTPETEAPSEVAEAPQADFNSLSVTNSGATTFCRVSGKTIATGQTVKISYKNAFLKSKAKRNFEQLNELAGKKRFVLEG